jgi:hypothetical protein
MKLNCTLSHLGSRNWLARKTQSLGKVEVTVPTREEGLTNLWDEL